MQDRKAVMKRWCGVMEWLDRLGYMTAGFSLLVLGMLTGTNQAQDTTKVPTGPPPALGRLTARTATACWCGRT